MTTPASSPDTAHKSRRRRSANGLRAAVRRLWHDWWVEILILALVLVAIFLLFERMNIRQTLRTWLVTGWHGLQGLISNLVLALVTRVQHTTLSDLVAYCLLVLAVVLIGWRTRRRLMTRPRFTVQKCPRCGSDIHRIHRHWHDHLLDLYVPVRRYQCEDPGCHWRGLRVKRSRYG